MPYQSWKYKRMEDHDLKKQASDRCTTLDQEGTTGTIRKYKMKSKRIMYQ